MSKYSPPQKKRESNGLVAVPVGGESVLVAGDPFDGLMNALEWGFPCLLWGFYYCLRGRLPFYAQPGVLKSLLYSDTAMVVGFFF